MAADCMYACECKQEFPAAVEAAAAAATATAVVIDCHRLSKTPVFVRVPVQVFVDEWMEQWTAPDG